MMSSEMDDAVDDLIPAKNTLIAAKDRLIMSKDHLITAKDNLITAMDNLIANQKAEILRLRMAIACLSVLTTLLLLHGAPEKKH